MTRGMASTFRTLAAAVSMTLLLSAATIASASDPTGACRAKPVVVKIHADWCGSCKALDSVWKRIETDLGSQATVVTLDVSDRVAYGESQAAAGRLGISEFFQEYRSRTGTVAVLECDTLEPVAILTGERSFEKYQTAISQAGGIVQ